MIVILVVVVIVIVIVRPLVSKEIEVSFVSCDQMKEEPSWEEWEVDEGAV